MVIERRIGELHIQSATRKALRIFAFADTVFPGKWTDKCSEEITIDLLEFAFHARRVHQICGFEDKSDLTTIERPLLKFTENEPIDWLDNYPWALDRLMHAKKYIFGYCHADYRKKFGDSESNLIPCYVKVETDKYPNPKNPNTTISLFGLANCFLGRVIPEVRATFPDWQY
jgi:hypothetical protein